MQTTPPDRRDGSLTKLRGHVATMVGLRGTNQDAHLLAEDCGLVVVADGVGGAPAGAFASRTVVDAVGLAFRESAALADRSRLAMAMARRQLRELGIGERAGMASTVAMVAVEGWRAVVTHAGDSRVYRMRGGALERLTHDHNLRVELERQGRDVGTIGRRKANAITRCLSSSSTRQRPPEHHELSVQPADRFLLCSDGLTKVCPDEVIARLLPHGDPRVACTELLAEARERFARDDTTVAVVDVCPVGSCW